jgi:hypothetical protein
MASLLLRVNFSSYAWKIHMLIDAVQCSDTCIYGLFRVIVSSGILLS